MKELCVYYKPLNIMMGILSQNAHQILFEYSDQFVATKLPVSPFHLPIQKGIQLSDSKFRKNLHGIFDDSLPDGWGLMLMDKGLSKRGVRAPYSPLDRLAYIGDSAMGALGYKPSLPMKDSNIFDIQRIAADSMDIFDGKVDVVLPELLKAGGSSGGARPKVLVGIKGNHMISGESLLPSGYSYWLIKFSAKKDAGVAGKMEYTCYKMACDAGIDMMHSDLFRIADHLFFGTLRFDRRANGDTIHTHTAANLIDADFRAPSLDYLDLCKLTHILTCNSNDVAMMFRLMVFNICIGNQDDHGKNFSFQMDKQGCWHLAPAYDLTESHSYSNEHSTSVNGKGKGFTQDDFLTIAKSVGLTMHHASDIINTVKGVVDNRQDYINAVDTYAKSIVQGREYFPD